MIAEALTAARYSALLRMLEAERENARAGNLDRLLEIAEVRRIRMRDFLSSGFSLPGAFISAMEARADRNDQIIREMTSRSEEKS